MKRAKTLSATGKTKDKALRQAKRWFSMNPNRWRVNVKLSANEVMTLTRGEVL